VHKEHADRDKEGYLKTIWSNEEIFYGTVSGFKGLERNCVILTINGFHDEVNPRELLYVGMTRARDFLVIVAKRSDIENFLDEKLLEIIENIIK